MDILTILIFGVLALVVLIILVYNNLIALRERVRNAWAQIETQLKRRFDLIPNLVETVKGYAEHEESTFLKVIEARNKFTETSGSVEGAAEAENMLSSSLKSIFALSESYPDLKANENFKALQIELTGTEDKIAFARQFYNDVVQKYNQTLLVFPNNIIVSLFGKSKFETAKFFEVEDKAQRENVKVEF